MKPFSRQRTLMESALRTPASKIAPVTTNPNVATVPEPTASVGVGQTKTETFTYFTAAPPATGSATEVLYQADRLWAKVTVELKTGGRVAVGTSRELAPVLSGRGILLTINQPESFVLARSVRLYVAATTLQRLNIKVEPLPWLEQITATLRSIAAGVVELATGKR